MPLFNFLEKLLCFSSIFLFFWNKLSSIFLQGWVRTRDYMRPCSNNMHMQTLREGIPRHGPHALACDTTPVIRILIILLFLPAWILQIFFPYRNSVKYSVHICFPPSLYFAKIACSAYGNFGTFWPNLSRRSRKGMDFFVVVPLFLPCACMRVRSRLRLL